MEIKDGKNTSELWFSVVMAAATAVIPLFVSEGVLTETQGSLIINILAELLPLLGFLVSGWIVTNYANNRTSLKKRHAVTQQNTAVKSE